MSWQAHVITLFAEMFPGPLGLSLAGRALERGLWSLTAENLRDHATDRHRSVDDTPCGGGPGMVLRPDVLDRALHAAPAGLEKIFLTPRGKKLTQAKIRALAAGPGVVLVCGRFEGFDQRVIEAWGATELSLGDFVLSGGEPAALAVLDACVRLLPGVMGAALSAVEESFSADTLEYPQYTRPAEWQGRRVPEVLLSGDHAAIAAWRAARARADTHNRRPDLLAPVATGA